MSDRPRATTDHLASRDQTPKKTEKRPRPSAHRDTSRTTASTEIPEREADSSPNMNDSHDEGSPDDKRPSKVHRRQESSATDDEEDPTDDDEEDLTDEESEQEEGHVFTITVRKSSPLANRQNRTSYETDWWARQCQQITAAEERTRPHTWRIHYRYTMEEIQGWEEENDEIYAKVRHEKRPRTPQERDRMRRNKTRMRDLWEQLRLDENRYYHDRISQLAEVHGPTTEAQANILANIIDMEDRGNENDERLQELQTAEQCRKLLSQGQQQQPPVSGTPQQPAGAALASILRAAASVMTTGAAQIDKLGCELCNNNNRNTSKRTEETTTTTTTTIQAHCNK